MILASCTINHCKCMSDCNGRATNGPGRPGTGGRFPVRSAREPDRAPAAGCGGARGGDHFDQLQRREPAAADFGWAHLARAALQPVRSGDRRDGSVPADGAARIRRFQPPHRGDRSGWKQNALHLR